MTDVGRILGVGPGRRCRDAVPAVVSRDRPRQAGCVRKRTHAVTDAAVADAAAACRDIDRERPVANRKLALGRRVRLQHRQRALHRLAERLLRRLLEGRDHRGHAVGRGRHLGLHDEVL